ncbi:MAG: ComF family protein [Pseudomonadota bacterium]
MARNGRESALSGLAEYIGSVFRQLLQGISRHLPSQCAVCHAWPSHSVCEACVAAFAQPVARCHTCALTLHSTGVHQCGACIVAPPPLDACFAALPYAYPWSSLIADFKFHQHPGWATSFAALLRAAPWVEPALDATDLLLPMPLSKERLRERGYNQAHVLACALDAPKVAHGILLRVLDTPPQRTLPRSERLRAVQDAFAVDPLQAHRVRQRRVALVDDVMTSGASLHAAARVLRGAGAAHITALVLARTE